MSILLSDTPNADSAVGIPALAFIAVPPHKMAANEDPNAGKRFLSDQHAIADGHIGPIGNSRPSAFLVSIALRRDRNVTLEWFHDMILKQLVTYIAWRSSHRLSRNTVEAAHRRRTGHQKPSFSGAQAAHRLTVICRTAGDPPGAQAALTRRTGMRTSPSYVILRRITTEGPPKGAPLPLEALAERLRLDRSGSRPQRPGQLLSFELIDDA